MLHILGYRTALRGEKILAFSRSLLYTVINTRAVPLVRKDDVHQGRVFYWAECSSLWRIQ